MRKLLVGLGIVASSVAVTHLPVEATLSGCQYYKNTSTEVGGVMCSYATQPYGVRLKCRRVDDGFELYFFNATRSTQGYWNFLDCDKLSSYGWAGEWDLILVGVKGY